ncbi:hypothetical protein [Sphingopyxis fribergensis]|nr:hypothetical protein [Sphingopyxis fribergensis]
MNELIQIGPISPLRQRLIDDMTEQIPAADHYPRPFAGGLVR